MTHPQSQSAKARKKADPFAAIKISIMMISIIGTMAGWLVLLNQENQTAAISTAVSDSTKNAVTKATIVDVDINQLRQVNAAPAQEIQVVARTRSSR
ncbi:MULTISPECIES: hypothetical protein [Psychrobacter]|uniref:hypothetical protein n=1 Tax=Psychrobacter TaxID=497 RepID=UPI00146DD616|nr:MULTISPECIES: hypothetical protein [Psychrobacter]